MDHYPFYRILSIGQFFYCPFCIYVTSFAFASLQIQHFSTNFFFSSNFFYFLFIPLNYMYIFSSSFLHTALLIPRKTRPEFISHDARLIETAKRFLRFIRIETSTTIGHVWVYALRWTSSIASSSRTRCRPLYTTPNDNERISEC